MDHETLRGWLDQEADGGLDPAERALMVAHLAECADCRHELDELRGVGAFLAAGRVEARQGFDAAVMSALPAAGWEGRNREAWRLPLALLALLGGTAAILFGVSAARLEPGAAFFNAASAIADLFASAALAGAGLLAASWKGLGMGVAQLLLGSRWLLAGAGFAVVGANLLLWRWLRRPVRRGAMAKVTTAGRGKRS